jgi:hypothetical protein
METLQLKQNVGRKLNRHFETNISIRSRRVDRLDERHSDHLVRVALRRHHDDFTLDQLDILTLPKHSCLDHASNVIDAESAAGRQAGGWVLHCDIHDDDLFRWAI